MRPTEIIYLSSPYSHHEPWVRSERFQMAKQATGLLVSRDLIVYSPIVHSHPINWAGHDKPDVHAFWMRQHLPILRLCGKVLVLKLEGWDRSRGVGEEVEAAIALKVPVEYATLGEIERM